MNCANHTDRERVAFCQNCGKPLCQECMRAVGSAVFCEPCLAAKLSAATATSTTGNSYTDSTSGTSAQTSGGTYTYPDPVSGVFTSRPVPPASGPNPVLAGLLGFIPGVGAMYNEQYAKGIVHLIVFAILVSLTDNHGIFGLFVSGWVFYMAIEAYHTARARRDGLPLPNPFGLNDLGERLGFGKSWGAPTANPFVHPTGTSGPAAGSTPNPSPSDPYGTQPPVAGSAPQNPAATWSQPPAQPYGQVYGQNYGQNYGQTYGQGPGWEAYVPPMSPMTPQVPLDSQVGYPGNRFPAGALWLIGFGTLFLIGNAGLFRGFSTRLFLPFLLMGLGVFLFVRKMTSYGGGLTSDGTASYRLRVFRALRGSVWVALVGLLFFLDQFEILSWGHSWPLFIILAGVMTVFERAAYSAAMAAGPQPFDPAYGGGYAAAPAASAGQPFASAAAPADKNLADHPVADQKEGE